MKIFAPRKVAFILMSFSGTGGLYEGFKNKSRDSHDLF
jgi:hypothetical protein